ncbi:MAG: enolase C-terminal domain-like protein, partial [Campylobacterota bacterium]|nr:enolase C-terminal domain-like protein [Campylobacterota bacterium]
IDANQAWSEAETLEIIEAISDLNITLIEQPVSAEELESMQHITAESTIPILADESVFTLEDAKKVIETKAADMINIKLMKCGGIYKAVEIIRLCEANGIRCMMGSMLEGPTSIAAAAHLSMVYPETISYLDLDSPLLYRSLPEESPITFHRNHLSTLSAKGITKSTSG